MGKGYNNYMTKKPFHPGSKANIKRTWMAEQKTENEKRKQEDLKVQYEKEQELYNNRALLSTESKDKLQLNFMYEAPPGAKRERQKEDDEPEYKFEWQRKYNAPREDYAKGNADIKDQPFGIPVRNVRCIKCHKWGHINTDKECPLYSLASSSSMPTTSMDPLELMRQMREDGLDLKQNVLGHQLNMNQANQQFIPSDESDPEMEFLKALSSKQKRKLLKKLNKLSKKQKKKDAEAKKRKCKKKDKSKSRKRSSSSESDSDEPQVKKSKKPKEQSSSSDSESDSESDREDKVKNAKKSSKSSEQQHGKKKTTSEKHKSSCAVKQKSKVASTFQQGSSLNESKDINPKRHKKHETERKLKQEPQDDETGSRKTETKASELVPDRKIKLEKDQHHSATVKQKDTEKNVESGKVKILKDKAKHPDGFDHDHPQRAEAAKKEGSHIDKFRNFHRHRRSPSVKHKYRSTRT